MPTDTTHGEITMKWTFASVAICLIALGIGLSTEAQDDGSGSAVWSMMLYGNTPSLAWSPNGQHLAFNQAYEYYGFSDEEAAFASSLGLWVYSLESGEARMLENDQRYHPAWLGDDLVVSGCSNYESCEAGLYVNGLDGSRRLLRDNAFFTQAFSEYEIIYRPGRSDGYYLLDLRMDSEYELMDDSHWDFDEWEPHPQSLNQCPQRIGDTTVHVNRDGLWLTRNGEEPVLIDSTPPHQYQYLGEEDETSTGRDYIKPCLHPDGNSVAYVAAGSSRGNMELRIVAIAPNEEPVSNSDVEPGLCAQLDQRVDLFSECQQTAAGVWALAAEEIEEDCEGYVGEENCTIVRETYRIVYLNETGELVQSETLFEEHHDPWGSGGSEVSHVGIVDLDGDGLEEFFVVREHWNEEYGGRDINLYSANGGNINEVVFPHPDGSNPHMELISVDTPNNVGAYVRWALVEWYWHEVVFEVVLLAEPDHAGALQFDNDTSRQIVRELCPSPASPSLDISTLDFEEMSQHMWCLMAWGQDVSLTLNEMRLSCQTDGDWEGCSWLFDLENLVEGGVPFVLQL